jgi:hypothetical protein
MSRELPAEIPAPVARALDADPLPDDGLTILVLTERDGWPHLAMISRGEIVTTGPRTLRLALWPTASTVPALEAAGRTTLSLVVDGVAYLLRVLVQRGPDVAHLARFDAEVAGVLEDEAPYATIASGVTFTLHDPPAVLDRWARTRAALREAP